MGRLSPYEEEKLAHSYHNYSLIGFLILSLGIIALSYTAIENKDVTVHIVAQTFGWIFDIAVAAGRQGDVSIHEVEFRHWDGNADYEAMSHQRYSPEEKERILKNPWALWKYRLILEDPKRYKKRVPKSKTFATFLRKTYQISFGSTDISKCNYDIGGRPEGWPSILRTLELSWSAQLVVRGAILFTFYIRWYYAYVRTLAVLNVNRGRFVRILACASPKLQLIETVLAFLISCFQQDNDASLLWCFPYIVTGWIGCVCVYMLVFTLMSTIDSYKAGASNRLCQLRFVCLFTCLFCAPIWLKTHLVFIARKTCFAEIPIRDALAEYVTVVAVVVFVISQLYEMRNYWGMLSCEDRDCCVELNDEFEDVYHPVEGSISRPGMVKNRLNDYSIASSRASSDVYLL